MNIYQQAEKEAETMPTVGFKKLKEDAKLPTKAHGEDSGFDIYALEDTLIYPGQTVVVKSGVAVDLPQGYDSTMRPRSGITSKTKLRVQLGTVDNPYTGDLGVIVDNVNPSYSPIASVAVGFSDVVSRKLGLNIDESLEIRENFQNVVENIFFSKEVDTLQGREVTDESYPIGTYLIKKGDKIAQLVVHTYYDKTAIEVSDIAETSRGSNGFGSTGVANG